MIPVQVSTPSGDGTRDAPNAVHIWYASLDVPPPVLRTLQATLSADERARAERFRFDVHRQRFVAARGILRHILGRLLEVESHRLTFNYGDGGKPFLAPENGANHLFFNVAHSREHAIFATTSAAELGVDIEVVRPMPNALDIARRFFSTVERAALEREPDEARTIAFFKCWTRKEAFVKAIGRGLLFPLDSFSVLNSPERAITFHTADQLHAASSWSLVDLSNLPTYVAAVAIERADASLRLKRWAI